MPPSQTRLDFDPARDGFAFANSFRWTEADLDFLDRMVRPLSTAGAALLPAAGAALTGGTRGFAAGGALGLGLGRAGLGTGLVRAAARQWASFGLCGGMALAAAERWPHRGGLPTAELKQEHVRPLLWRRQARTLRASGPAFARHWLAARLGRPTPSADLRREWDGIRRQIDAGRPVVLGLAGDAPDPFSQHQVLAFGYAGGSDQDTLFVYDPNAPGKERTIAIALSGAETSLTTDLPVGPTARGGYHVSTRPGRLSMVFRVPVA
ncbi:MAG: hypothetical protein AAGI91_07750 [Bacteroidota bacterium]